MSLQAFKEEAFVYHVTMCTMYYNLCLPYRNLGIPNVTFISPRPAKWKVFNVICVDGSPID